MTVQAAMTMEELRCYKSQLRQKHPVIHHITNFVTIYPCARITALLGAAPIMAFAPEEAAQVTAKAQALVINTGTLNPTVIEAIPKSLTYANAHNIPVVLDPVGVKLSDYRYNFVTALLEAYRFDVIRCNAAELLNLLGVTAHSKGVDGNAQLSPSDMEKAVLLTADKYNCVIACTGPTDYISDGRKVVTLNRGVAQLPKLVGTGCMVNSLIGAYLPVCQTPLDAAVCGILTMCAASEHAAARLKNPDHLGTFETYLMDAICAL